MLGIAVMAHGRGRSPHLTGVGVTFPEHPVLHTDGMIYAFINPDPYLSPEAQTGDGDRVASSMAHLLQAAELIPVTARDEEQLLDLPAAFTSWQVLLSGAVVVRPDGTEDHAWRRLTLQTQTTHAQALALAGQAIEHISMFGHHDLEITTIQRGGYPLMVRASHPHSLLLATESAAHEWQEWIDAGPFASHLRMTRDRGTLCVLPRELGVDSAVNYVLGHLDDADMTLGVGSTEADRSFLSLCDLALVPGTLVWPDAQLTPDSDVE